MGKLTDLPSNKPEKGKNDFRKSRTSKHLDLIAEQDDLLDPVQIKQETGIEIGVTYKVDKNQPDAVGGRFYLKKSVKGNKGEEII